MGNQQKGVRMSKKKTYEVELTGQVGIWTTFEKMGLVHHDEVGNINGDEILEWYFENKTGVLKVDFEHDGEWDIGRDGETIIWRGGVRHDIEVIASSLSEAQELSEEVAENLDTGMFDIDWDYDETDEPFVVWTIDGIYRTERVEHNMVK